MSEQGPQVFGRRADMPAMTRLKPRWLIACLALSIPLFAAPGARADLGGGGGAVPAAAQAQSALAHTPCQQRVIENPFTAWSDTADYFLIPDGNAYGSAGEWWDISGAGIAAENETYSAYTDEDSSVQVTGGNSATTAMVCVDPDTPTMRFFVRSNGESGGTLHVEALYEDEVGDQQSADLGTLDAVGDEWAPSPALDILAPLAAVLDNGQAPVWFRFTAEGEGSSFLVDDVYVDPYGKG
jgi:hypothetical protein